MNPTLKTLCELLGANGVMEGPSVSARATSFWDVTAHRASAILRPQSTEEVSRILAICHRDGMPLVTQGGRTGCSQGADARDGELAMSTERMNVIEHIDPVGATATVQAGVTLQALQEAAREHGLLFALDLGARGSCTIGGNVATNAGGINVLRYGMMRAQVLGLEAVLADGTVVSSMNHMLKNNAGFDLKQLMIGTEGTLGVVTRAVVRLHPLPRSRNTALVALNSFGEVTTLLNRMQRELAGTLSAFEVMWNNYYRAATAPGGHRSPMAGEHPFYVLMEAEGADPGSDGERFMQVLEAVLDEGLIVDAVVPQSDTERRALWDMRENFEAMMAGRITYLYDVSLPLVEMESYADEVLAAMERTWPKGRAIIFGHVADGNLHLFIQPEQDGASHAQSDALVYGPLATRQGSVSAEHGIGMEKQGWLNSCRSEAEIALMRTLKQTLDPKGILNPGRVIPPA